MVHVPRSVAWLTALGLVGFLLGCNQSSTPTSSTPPGQPGAQAAAEPFDTSGPHSDGKKVVVASGCFRCHSIDGRRAPVAGGPMGGWPGGPGGGRPPMGGGPGGRGGPSGPGAGGPPMAGGPGGPGGRPPMGGPGGMMGGRRAPDLGKVGGEPGHTVDWFVKYIRNPKSVKPDARMPAFDDKKIKDEDLRVLAEYLASLK